ncbi:MULTISPECIES: class I SAM-dependent methyltransferase [Thermomonosporaceae]|uniref:class I SAM-dependent methyltransferase n=1 Tax=Thermomonosporaceae TaxID=2012 RepID=UPI00255B21CA|nr:MULTISPECIES: methyltransferase domain-containing protein [Thermomonosporaceae]MDL4774497.1 methyltransferase domain-containing protein [Actinomadura xylanilytica]
MTPWTSDEPARSPFALPRGVRGRLAGLFMLCTNRQRDLLGLLGVRAGERILEVGYGPGGLIRHLRRTPARLICGVDPSPEMRDLAAGPHRAQIAAGRIDLRIGTADRTGFADAAFDAVVSVNNVGLWPDLEAGMRELHRVTRPGGRVLIAWHGGRRPSPLTRRLSLPEHQLARVERALRDRFSGVRRDELPGLTVFGAVR